MATNNSEHELKHSNGLEGVNPIATVIPVVCPHDGKTIYVSVLTMAPIVKKVLTEEDVVQAKKAFKIALKNLEAPDIDKFQLENWVDDPTTLFGPDEVESILENIKNNYA